MTGMALSNASPITLQTSGVNVAECLLMYKDDFLGIQFDCKILHLYILMCYFNENYK